MSTTDSENGSKRIFICGSALRGQPDHQNLQSATFLGEAKTAAKYRLHAIKDGWHPGIYVADKTEDKAGISIPGELYELTREQYDYLLKNEPPDMYPEAVDLENGEQAIAMLYPRDLSQQWPDISEIGGWAAYKKEQG